MKPRITLLLLLCLPTPATAQGAVKDTLAHRQDTTGHYALSEVKLVYKADANTPVTFQNISGRRLQEFSVGQEPSFILAATPSVTVYSDAGAYQGYSYYRLRGMDQTRVNTTLDGVPMNEPEDQGAYFSNYPDILNTLSSIQIQRGTGTSKNGTAAYAGSIQLFSPELNTAAGTTAGIGYGSFNSYRAFLAHNTNGLKHHKVLSARASAIHTDGYKYHSPNTAQSVAITAASHGARSLWQLNFLAGHQQNVLAWIGVPDSAIAAEPRTNANSPAERDEFTQALLQLKHQYHVSGSVWTAQTAAYYTYLNGNYSFDLNNFLSLPADGTLYNYAFLSGLAGAYSTVTYAKSGLSASAGIHANTYYRRHTGSEQTLGQLYRNTGYKKEASAFLKLGYEWGRFLLQGDAQYRYTTFSYIGNVPLPHLHWQFLNPKGGISYHIGKSTTYLYYSIGATGREPTRNDMFLGNDDLATDNLGHPLLGPTAAEHVTDQELGIRHQWAHGHIDVNAYYMRFRNEIVLNGQLGPNGLALTNQVDASYRSGIELSGNYSVTRHLTLINNSSLSLNRISEQGIAFRPVLSPAVIINQSLQYTLRSWSVMLSARYQSVSWLNFANSSALRPYLLLNACISKQVSTRWAATLFLNNLTNIRYYNNGSLSPNGQRLLFVQAPFNAYASLTFSL